MSEQSNSQERMIAAAVRLFSRTGFHGTTTKEIAESANVSESNIFRYFPTKRDLFLGALESELYKLSVRAEALTNLAGAENAHAALLSLFGLISETMAKQPELVRLLHFSALEFGPDIQPVFRKHLWPIVKVAEKGMHRWFPGAESCSSFPASAVMSSIATVMMMQDFSPAFSGYSLPFGFAESAAAIYADIWSQALSVAPKAEAVPV